MTNLNNGEGIPMSANVDIICTGVKPEACGVFTSATRPLRLTFFYKMRG